mmetsp:Transcript_40086/g.113491  ORF Transcript_40086/g.113491 Transcript_40086/m.113491 type:complete len:86 (-) Transcript_40086:702-959(-)
MKRKRKVVYGNGVASWVNNLPKRHFKLVSHQAKKAERHTLYLGSTLFPGKVAGLGKGRKSSSNLVLVVSDQGSKVRCYGFWSIGE